MEIQPLLFIPLSSLQLKQLRHHTNPSWSWVPKLYCGDNEYWGRKEALWGKNSSTAEKPCCSKSDRFYNQPTSVLRRLRVHNSAALELQCMKRSNSHLYHYYRLHNPVANPKPRISKYWPINCVDDRERFCCRYRLAFSSQPTYNNVATNNSTSSDRDCLTIPAASCCRLSLTLFRTTFWSSCCSQHPPSFSLLHYPISASFTTVPLSLPSSVLQPISLHYWFLLQTASKDCRVHPSVCASDRPSARPPTANRSRKSLTLCCRSNTQETERLFLGFKEERDVETERQTSRDEQKIHPF